MKNMAIIYGSTTMNTKDAATMIAQGLEDYSPVLLDVEKVQPEDLSQYDVLILGTSTWNFGDLQDDWMDALPRFSDVDFTGKIVAIFGMGDAMGWGDNFVDGIGEIYEFVTERGATAIGEVSADEYNFDSSRAFKDGVFVGLPLDADNEPHLTKPRITAWVDMLKEIIG